MPGTAARLHSGLKHAVPPAFQPIAREVYYSAFRTCLRARCWCADRFPRVASGVPLPPARLRYRVCESVSAAEFLRIGAGCAHLLESQFLMSGVDLGATQRVLDFGCGCGRTLRWLLNQSRHPEFHGADIDAEAIDWCTAHLPHGQFRVCAPEPPLPYPREYFDAVYRLSVFTHLSEPMQDAWLEELWRILKPGGTLLISVFGAAAREQLDQAGRMELERTGFVHRCSRKLHGVVPDWYQTSWHSPGYMEQRLRRHFTEVRYRVVEGGLQDLVAARRAG